MPPSMPAISLCLLLGACRDVEPAPVDIDSLLHHFWQNARHGEQESLAQGAISLHSAALAGSLEGPMDGLLTSLDEQETDLAGLSRDVDPSQAVGLFMVNPLACQLERVEAIALSLEQDQVYDSFESYSRSYTSDLQAYQQRSTDRLTWDVTYEVGIPLAGIYQAELAGGARWVPTLSDAQSPYGPLLVTWSVLTEPAVFEESENIFDQDWRVEVYYEPEAGRTIHAEGLWRHMEAGVVSTDSENIQRMILNGLADWDARTDELCAAGLP